MPMSMIVSLSFLVVLTTGIMIQSRKCSYGFEIYAFPLTKFEQRNFPLFIKFTPKNLNYTDMTSEHRNFLMYRTRVKQDIFILYTY